MKLKLDPIVINDDVWIYEERSGISIYANANFHSGTVIPFSKLRKSPRLVAAMKLKPKRRKR